MSKNKGVSRKGYEPNSPVFSALSFFPGSSMDYGGRSQSVPVGDRGAVGNPFYSEKTQNQCLIDAARPSDLPVHDDGPTGIFGGPGMVGQSNAESQPSGKGRGGCSAGAMRQWMFNQLGLGC